MSVRLAPVRIILFHVSIYTEPVAIPPFTDGSRRRPLKQDDTNSKLQGGEASAPDLSDAEAPFLLPGPAANG